MNENRRKGMIGRSNIKKDIGKCRDMRRREKINQRKGKSTKTNYDRNSFEE